MTGAARFLNNLYGNLVGTINGYSIAKSVPSDAVFTDTKYTASNTTPQAVASSGSAGSSAQYSRRDHKHAISVATGDSSGQVKIAGQNATVKDIAASAYKAFDGKPTNGHSNYTVSSGGVHSRIAYKLFTLSSSSWSTAYNDAVFDTTGIVRQALSFAQFTASTKIVSVDLAGDQSATLSGTKYLDQQFGLICEVETGASTIEFRATTAPTVNLKVLVGYCNEDVGDPISTQASSLITGIRGRFTTPSS